MLRNEYFIKNFIKSQASTDNSGYVQLGYGQVEINHMSAQRTGQIYAQLPANPDIEVLEQGQFVKYDYAANDNGIGEVNFTGEGEWMLVYNEIKLYRDFQLDCEFAMRKDDYQARIYTPYDWENTEYVKRDANGKPLHTRYLNGEDDQGNTSMTQTFSGTQVQKIVDADANVIGYMLGGKRYAVADVTVGADDDGNATYTVEYVYDDVTASAMTDIYELYYNEDPFTLEGSYEAKRMRKDTTMVPRVYKTNVGDIFTTNMIAETSLAIGDVLAPRAADGILSKSGDLDSMKWQVVKLYTMPDNQPGVKLMRIA